MKKILINVIWVLIIVTFLVAMYPLYDWFQNEELTRIQVFKKWWWVELGSIFLITLLLFCMDKVEEEL